MWARYIRAGSELVIFQIVGFSVSVVRQNLCLGFLFMHFNLLQFPLLNMLIVYINVWYEWEKGVVRQVDFGWSGERIMCRKRNRLAYIDLVWLNSGLEFTRRIIVHALFINKTRRTEILYLTVFTSILHNSYFSRAVEVCQQTSRKY